jgi:hypothetical protein
MNSEVIFAPPVTLWATPLTYFMPRDDSDFDVETFAKRFGRERLATSSGR